MCCECKTVAKPAPHTEVSKEFMPSASMLCTYSDEINLFAHMVRSASTYLERVEKPLSHVAVQEVHSDLASLGD